MFNLQVAAIAFFGPLAVGGAIAKCVALYNKEEKSKIIDAVLTWNSFGGVYHALFVADNNQEKFGGLGVAALNSVSTALTYQAIQTKKPIFVMLATVLSCLQVVAVAAYGSGYVKN